MHLWLAALAAIALTPPPRLAKVAGLRSPPPSCNILDDVLSSKVAKRSRRMARKAQRSLVDEYEPETTDAFVELPIMFTNEREMQSFDHNRWKVWRKVHATVAPSREAHTDAGPAVPRGAHASACARLRAVPRCRRTAHPVGTAVSCWVPSSA